jgi:hypothetical protein
MIMAMVAIMVVVTPTFVLAAMFIKMTVTVREAVSGKMAGKTMPASPRASIHLRQSEPKPDSRANGESFPKKHPSIPCKDASGIIAL